MPPPLLRPARAPGSALPLRGIKTSAVCGRLDSSPFAHLSLPIFASFIHARRASSFLSLLQRPTIAGIFRNTFLKLRTLFAVTAPNCLTHTDDCSDSRRLLRPSRVPSTVAHRHSFDRRPGTCSRRYKGCYGLLRADKRSHREQSKGPKRERPCAFRSGTGPLAKLTRGHDSPPTPTGCVAKEPSAGGVQNPKAPA